VERTQIQERCKVIASRSRTVEVVKEEEEEEEEEEERGGGG
jgi:hypothetical protein